MRGGPSVLGIVLAGGEGKRLMPLTADRAKPAVTFGGTYRLVDFVLSSLVNADVLRICVLTQYKSHSLDRHVSTTWRMSSLLGNYVTPVPAQQRLGPRWYLGSADAILQSLNLVHDEQPDYVAVFGADHVYRMDPRQMLAKHIDNGAGVTVAGIKVPRADASSFGIITPGSDGTQVDRFLEKPTDPPGLPGEPDRVFASMGNYLFTTKVLVDALHRDAEDPHSVHDMGGSILPMLTARGQAQVYDFDDNHVPGETSVQHGYWRDVGTLDAYYDAHMDLLSDRPAFSLDNRRWPIYTHTGPLPPARIVAAWDRERVGHRTRLCDPRPGLPVGPLARRHRRRGGRRPGSGTPRQRQGGSRGHRAGSDPRQERRRAPRGGDRRQPRAGPGVLHGLRQRRHRPGQGTAGALRHRPARPGRDRPLLSQESSRNSARMRLPTGTGSTVIRSQSATTISMPWPPSREGSGSTAPATPCCCRTP